MIIDYKVSELIQKLPSIFIFNLTPYFKIPVNVQFSVCMQEFNLIQNTMILRLTVTIYHIEDGSQ